MTAWSLPLVYDVETVTLDRPSTARTTAYAAQAPRAAWREAKVAYLLPWGFDTAALVSRALRDGMKVRQAGEPFTAGGRHYDTGTAVVRVAENEASALERLAALAAAAPSVEVVALDSAWVDQGVSLGSSEVVALKAPRVLARVGRARLDDCPRGGPGTCSSGGSTCRRPPSGCRHSAASTWRASTSSCCPPAPTRPRSAMTISIGSATGCVQAGRS